MANFLTCESLIIARLQAKIDAADWTGKTKPVVLAEAEVERIEERSQVAPAVWVLLNGYQPVGDVGVGAVTTFELNWQIVVAVRSGYGMGSSEGVRLEAAPIVDVVLDALLGWKPSKDFAHMRAEQSPGPGYSDAGFGYFPHNFTTRTTVRGSVT